jgi:protein disulfide-isomerase
MKHAILSLFLLGILPLHASELWSTNYEESLKTAASENRMVLLEFTGSDWCPPCKKLAEDVFAQPAFEEFAKTNLVPVKLDFPRRSAQTEDQKAANQALATKYNIDGFPTLILLDSKGGELAREVGYDGGGVNGFIAWVNKYKK